MPTREVIALALTSVIVFAPYRSAQAVGPVPVVEDSPRSYRGTTGVQAVRGGPKRIQSEQPVDDSIDPQRQAERVEEATRYFIEGRAHFDTGEYAEAAASFERSYAAIPSENALYNRALSYERSDQPAAAIASYRRYLEMTEIPREERLQIEEAVARLKSEVGEVTLDVESGVELRQVRINGRVIPFSAFPLLVDPGRVEVELLGRRAGDRRLRIAQVDAGSTVVIDVAEFDRAPTSTTVDAREGSQPPSNAERERMRRRQDIVRPLFWTGVAATVGGGVAIIVLGSLTKQAERDHNASKCPEVCRDEDFMKYPYAETIALKNRAIQRQGATNAMIGVTAVLGLATIGLGIFGKDIFRLRRGRLALDLQGTGVSLRW